MAPQPTIGIFMYEETKAITWMIPKMGHYSGQTFQMCSHNVFLKFVVIFHHNNVSQLEFKLPFGNLQYF